MNYEEEDDELQQQLLLQKQTLRAALCIQKSFRAYCDVRVFKFLKAAVCKAEQCVAIDMLQKISPGEAELLKDPAYNARLRFRFGGHSFPPYIVYKIFLSQSVKYFSAATMIPAGSIAAHEACRVMGARTYTSLVMNDLHSATPMMPTQEALQKLNGRGQLRVAGLWDSQPHWVGGRGNDWRMLLQADYSSAFRLDAVHRGRQVNESVTDDVAASMLGSLSGMGESMPRNVHSSHMKQAFATRQKTSQKRAKLRRMKELYASHLGSGGTASALAGGDSDGNISASDDELLQWSSKLSFDAYHSAWEAVASTASDAGKNACGSATNSPMAFTTTPLPL